ncbi:MAG: ribose-5-phosphate isomerase RpiA [Candidatus Helarchaeota archaeon]
MSEKEEQKKMAAQAALTHVETEQIIGIGSGSTIDYFIELLKKKIETEKIKIRAVPTSYQSAISLIKSQIPITTLNEHKELDLAIDGADEIDPALNLIKGGGAALTQEKVVDAAAKKLIIIADESKKVDKLGEKMAIPIEVIPMSYRSVESKLKQYSSTFSLRGAIKKMGPVITDNGNFIIDARIVNIDNPKLLELKLNGIPGVIENGLFIDMADIVYIGTKSKSIELVR